MTKITKYWSHLLVFASILCWVSTVLRGPYFKPTPVFAQGYSSLSPYAGLCSMLPNCKGVSLSLNSAANGDNDFLADHTGSAYIPAAGRRYLMTGGMFAGGTSSCFPEIKDSGTYYTLQAGRSSSALGQTWGMPTSLVLEGGGANSFGMNCNSTGTNVWAYGFEYDASITAPFTKYNFTGATSATAIYTAPSSPARHAASLSSVLAIGGVGGVIGGSCTYYNISGGSQTLTLYLIPSGGSAGSTTQMYTNAVTSSTAVNPMLGGFVLGPGDSLQFTTTNTNAHQMLACSFVEMP